MTEKPDAQLLREYVAQQSEPAFGELVRRHADLVYSAALRQVASPDWAADIAQRVFIDLARKAHRLADRTGEQGSITAWLFRATRYAALNLLREERRRHSRERMFMPEPHPGPESALDWAALAPFLDEAMSSLKDQEREAVLLRFFKNQDFRAVGQALGVSDDTAQKCVARSLEKLRAALARRGVTTTSGALATAMAANAVHAAPAGLAATWIGASLAGATVKTGTAMTLLKIMSMTKIQIGLSAIVAASLAVASTVEYKAARRARDENQALRQQVASLEADNATLSNRLQRAATAPSLIEDQLSELLRLRGEVGALRKQTNALAQSLAEAARLREENTAMSNAKVEMFRADQAKIVNAAKILGLAARTWLGTNNDRFPTNLASMSNVLHDIGYPTYVPMETFDLVNIGTADETLPLVAFAREHVARQSPNGGWSRVYLFCDGAVQAINTDNGDFDTWERQHPDFFPPPAR